MLPLFNFLKTFFARRLTRLNGDDAYLSESVDIYDLERRMRSLDDGRRSALSGIAFGLYPR
jgi:Protein of unknown function (DUF3563)